MASIDLNIIQRGLKGQAWTAEKGPLSPGDLEDISEQRTDNSSALNAMPTPFARFFVIKEAFRRALEELKNPGNAKKAAGDAYNRLVSDTLDVFELLFNLNFHKSRWGRNRQIDIREWSYADQLQVLKNDMPILSKAVEAYFNSDLHGLSGKLLFVVLNEDGREYLLAASSPFTGFVTPPDLDKKTDPRGRSAQSFAGKRYENFPAIHRKSGGFYFRDIKLFGERDKDFKNYMVGIVNKLGNDQKELRDYVKQFIITDRDIVNDWHGTLEPLFTNDSNQVSANGLEIFADAGISTVNFFNDTLIRLPYRISEDYFRTMTFDNDSNSRDYDYLLPVSREALAIFDGDFECRCKETSTKTIVTLIFKGREYKREYSADGAGSTGRIVNLRSREQIDLNVATFPCILSPNPAENNWFKVMVAVNDCTEDYRPFSIDKLSLTFFFKEGGKYLPMETVGSDNTKALFGVRPGVVRSRQDNTDEIDASSKFYEVFRKPFDAVDVRLDLDSLTAEGLLLPKWKTAQRTADTYTYAIDLGTTNTYISCTKNGEDNEPEQLSMNEPMVAYLHKFRKSPQHPLSSVIENGIPSPLRKNFLTEFVPPLIDGTSAGFPLRTALCVTEGESSNVSLFDNCNLAFFYEKAAGLGNQTVLTDIKWDKDNDLGLRMFIRELLLIVKSDVLQKNGQLSATRLIWFRPLSFKAGLSDLYRKIWEEEAKAVLNVPASQIETVSESEAPYYYFRKMNAFDSIDAVSIVDIGGGSTDFMYFADGKPQIANSVHFGCDVLWGNGFNEFGNTKENGLYNRFKDSLHFEDMELEKLNVRMQSSRTKDIVNFWLSNDEGCGIKKKLKESYRPLFLYHFASLIWFMARMYRSKGLQCPRCVLFCGNGSRYVDGLMTSSPETVGKLVTRIFEDVYGERIPDVQVLLPEVRKECTCYGGLYRKKDVEVPEEFNFQGIDGTEYEDVAALKRAFPLLKPALKESLGEFTALYKDLLHIMIRNGELTNTADTESIVQAVSTGLEDSLTKNFKTRIVEALNDNEIYHDSLFFLPVVDNILKLTKI